VKRWNTRQPRLATNRFARSEFNLPRPHSENIVMTPSSTSATGQPSACAVCSPNETNNIAPSASDTPCPRCGYLIWFTREELGNDEIVKPTVRLLQPNMVEKLIGLEPLFRAKRLALDFREVELVPSPSLGKLVRLNKTVQAASGRLVLRNLSPNLFQVFQITGLDRVFDVDA
jgi:anti-anti-sigma factor